MGVNGALVKILRSGNTGTDGKPIWGGRLPDGTTYDKGAVEVSDFNIPETSKDGQRNYRYTVQANVYGHNVDTTDDVGALVISDLHGLYGPVGGIDVRGCIYRGSPFRTFIPLKEVYQKILEFQLDLHVTDSGIITQEVEIQGFDQQVFTRAQTAGNVVTLTNANLPDSIDDISIIYIEGLGYSAAGGDITYTYSKPDIIFSEYISGLLIVVNYRYLMTTL